MSTSLSHYLFNHPQARGTKASLRLSIYNKMHQLRNLILTSFNKFTQSYCCSSVAQLCLTLCDPMNCSMPGFPVLHHLLEFAQTHVHWIDDANSSFVAPFSSCPQSFPASGSFPVSWVFTSGSKKYWSFSFSISASNEYRGLFSFRTDWFDLLSKGLSRIFFNTPVWRHQSFGPQPFLLSSSHIHTWLLEKP